ncbi:hypothetical protein ACVRY6_09830, partial [Streptococcus ictaluri]
YQEIIGQVEASLDEKERGQFQALIRGERFAGRQALLRRLRPYDEKERGQFQALIRGERFAGRQALLRRLRPYFEAFAP